MSIDQSQEKLLRKYAQVAVKIGVNLQRGQNLLVDAEPVHYDFVQILAEEAYKSGARLVEYRATTPELLTKRVTYGEDTHLDYGSNIASDYCNTILDEDWALLALVGDPLRYNGAAPQKLSRVWASNGEQGRFIIDRNTLFKAMTRKKIQSSIIAAASPRWAAQVLGGDANSAIEKRLWRKLAPILRLDKPDPVAAWQVHCSDIRRRCQLLDEKGFSRLYFEGDGTDLWITPMKTRKWGSAVWTSPKGIEYVCNVPTEEVGIAPDFRETVGFMSCPIPSVIMGTKVEHAWFKFEKGKVVDYGAEKGKEALDSLLKTDEGAKYTGEAALVDFSSPISKSGLIFNNVLLDENASCHIALGNAYPPSYAEAYTTDQLKEIGCNVSRIHEDFMIGSKHTSVYGIQADGSREEIMHKGKFILE